MDEWKNGAIIEMAGSMLHSKKMKLTLWEGAFVCAAHIINPTFTHVIQGMTPYENDIEINL